MVGTLGRYVRIQVNGTDSLRLAEVQVLKGREVPDYPRQLFRNSDRYFTVTNWDGSQERVSGNLKWDWCNGYMDPNATASDKDPTKIQDLVTPQDPPKVYSGSADTEFETSEAFESTKSWEDTWGLNFSYGMEGKILGMGAEWEVSGGFEKGNSNSLSQKKETYFQGNASSYSGWNDADYRYEYCPYYYVISSPAPDGVNQAYTVLDYYVPCYANTCSWTSQMAAASTKMVSAPGVTPAAPVIESATHPDPNTWYNTGTATFTWHQPAGDPVTNPGYNWMLDHETDTVPEPVAQGTRQTQTYHNLADGTWYLHVRAMQLRWPVERCSAPADSHRPAGADGRAGARPARPLRQPGLVHRPGDRHGHCERRRLRLGVDRVQHGRYNLAALCRPPALHDRHAADHHLGTGERCRGPRSEPVSTTLQVDVTPPNSLGSGVCLPGGACSGGIDESTSRIAGMEIQVDDGSWTSASALGEWQEGQPATPWAYAALLDVGHGHHILYGHAADGAGNLEAPHLIGEATFVPTASPDLSQSSIVIEPAVARPGEPVSVTLDLRNGGFGETYVAITATLPAGLAPAEGALDTFDHSITYDPATGVINWPVESSGPANTRGYNSRQ